MGGRAGGGARGGRGGAAGGGLRTYGFNSKEDMIANMSYPKLPDGTYGVRLKGHGLLTFTDGNEIVGAASKEQAQRYGRTAAHGMFTPNGSPGARFGGKNTGKTNDVLAGRKSSPIIKALTGKKVKVK